MIQYYITFGGEMKLLFLVLLIGLIGCDKEVTDSKGATHTVPYSFEIPDGWTLSERIGKKFFIVKDTNGKKWLLQGNDTGHGTSITLSKME